MKTKPILLTLTILALFSCGSLRRLPPDSPLIYDEGVVINGVRWATRNVGVRPRTFAVAPEDFGGYFTWEETQRACPRGWRTPTRQEIRSLANTESFWTIRDSVPGVTYKTFAGESLTWGDWVIHHNVPGRVFGSVPNQIFLPAGGFRFVNTPIVNNIGLQGHYWSDTHTQINNFTLIFDSDSVKYQNNTTNRRTDGLFVRCVAK